MRNNAHLMFSTIHTLLSLPLKKECYDSSIVVYRIILRSIFHKYKLEELQALWQLTQGQKRSKNLSHTLICA